MNKIEHEGIGTSARLKSDKVDQKVKWFLKVLKHTNFCGKHIHNILFPQVLFIQFYKFFDFHLPENESESQKLINITHFTIASMLFLQP